MHLAKRSREVSIYLSGSIKKSNSSSGQQYWLPSHLEELRERFQAKGIEVLFLNPADRSDDLSDEKSLFGRDMLQVYLSDFVLADNRERRGIGIGYEMAMANAKNIPVISWTPFNTKYRPKQIELLGQTIPNWTHPFVKNPSVSIADTLEEAVEFIATAPITAPLHMQSTDFMFEAMLHYINTQLPHDTEMQALIGSSLKLKQRVEQIRRTPVAAFSLKAIEPAAYPFHVQHVNGQFPVEIIGLDCSQTLSEEVQSQLRALLDHHQILVFRNQDMSKAAHVQFTHYFGKPDVAWDKKNRDPEHPEIMKITNKGSNHLYDWTQKSSSLLHWHADGSFNQVPNQYTLLHVKTLPMEGGDTKFINTRLGYAALPADLKQRVQGKKATHSYGFLFKKLWAARPDRDPSKLPQIEDATHPLVISNKATGEHALYISKLCLSQLSDETPEESEKLQTKLFQHLKKPAFKYTHKWQPGDLLVWDNFSLMHRGTFTDPDNLRELQRTTTSAMYPEGEAPKLGN